MATEIPKILAMQTVNGLPTILMEQDYRKVPNSSHAASQYRWFTPETARSLLQEAVDMVRGYYYPMVARVNGSIPGGSRDDSVLAQYQKQPWYALLSKDTSQMTAEQLLDELARAGYYSGDVNAAKQWLASGQSAGSGMVTLSPEEMQMLQLGPNASNYWQKSQYEKRLAEIQGINSGALVKVPIPGTDSFYTAPSNDPSQLAQAKQMADALSAQAAKGVAAITAGTPTGPQSTPLPPNFQVPTNQPLPADILSSAPSRAQLLAQAAAKMPQTNLSLGMQGPEVKQLQDLLVQYGFMTKEQVATGPGIFGPQTKAALIKFQTELAKNNAALAAAAKDFGNYGPLTRAAMTPENLARISQVAQDAASSAPDGNSAISSGLQSMVGSGVPAPRFEGDFSNVAPSDVGTMFQVYLSNMLSRQKKLQEAQDALNQMLNQQTQATVTTQGQMVGMTTIGRQLQRIREEYAYKLAPLQAQVESITSQIGMDTNMFNSLLAYGKYLDDINTPEIISNASGIYSIDPRTGSIKTIKTFAGGGGDSLSGAPSSYKEWVMAGGQAGTGKTYAQWLEASNIKAPTVAQQTVAEYAARIEQSSQIIDKLEDTISKMNYPSFWAQTKLPSAAQSVEMQQYMQAARNFINAKLRRESGAVISDSEFREAYAQYLPQAGDSPDVLKQKKATRDLVFASLRAAAGPAYISVEELMSGFPSVTPPTKGANISDDFGAAELIYTGKTTVPATPSTASSKTTTNSFFGSLLNGIISFFK